VLWETGEASAAGALFRWPGLACGGSCAGVVGAGLAPWDGPIDGNRPAAFPAPTNMLASPFRAGMGPSGSTAMCAAFGEAGAEFWADFFVFVAAEAAVTAVVSAAAGGVHFAVVTTLAVAVSFTELTEVAFEATAI
jgi:hypothetical protein